MKLNHIFLSSELYFSKVFGISEFKSEVFCLLSLFGPKSSPERRTRERCLSMLRSETFPSLKLSSADPQVSWDKYFLSEHVLFSVERKLLNICEKYFYLNMLNSLQATTQCTGLRCSFRALLVPSSSPSTFPPPCSSPCPGSPSSSPPTSCPPGLSSSSLSVSSSSTCSTPQREHSSQEES